MMTTLRKFATCMLACILMVSLFAIPAHALDYSGETATVYVNGTEVTGITAYVDSNGEIRVNINDLSRIFQSTGGSIYVSGSSDKILLRDVVTSLGFLYEQNGSKMYIYTDCISTPSDADTDNGDVDVDISNLVEVFVNNVKVKNVTVFAYNGEACIINNNDLYTLFPTEAEGWFFTQEPEVTPLSYWAESFDYTYSFNGSQVYLNKKGSTPTPVVPSTPSTSTTAEVFVNGMRINEVGVYVSGGEAYTKNYNDFFKLFPKETKNSSFPTVVEAVSVKTYAGLYGYTYRCNGNRVYLNNDGNSPVEVQLNGQTVKFIDQQPIVIRPGRTMVPVRTISELVGCSVEYDGAHKRVIIKKSNTTLILWINNVRYWLNGSYHEMDVVPQIINGRTMVPLRFISEAFGYTVEYDNSGTIGVVKLSS